MTTPTEHEPFHDMNDRTLLAYWNALIILDNAHNITPHERDRNQRHKQFVKEQMTKRNLMMG